MAHTWRCIQHFGAPLALAVLVGAPARGQGSLSRAFPNGGQRGTTLAVTFAGADVPENARLHVEGGGLEAVGPITKGAATLRLAPDAAPGPRLVRLVGSAGATSPRPFAVGTLPERLEKEPNNNPEQAEALESLPVTLNGTLPTRPDLDLFRVTLAKGQCLVVAGESRALGSPTNLLVRIRNRSGLALVTQVDFRTRDPLLGFTAPEAGEYLVELQDVLNNYSNIDANYVYRVTLTTGPWLDAAFPAGARRGADTRIAFSGWNLGGANGPSSLSEIVSVPPDAADRFEASAGGAPNRVMLAVAGYPEVEEQEGGAGSPLSLPVTVNGRIGARGDRDSFPFTAKAGERLAFDVTARDLGSFADIVLTVQDSGGKTLATGDDADRGRDSYLLWTAPADGAYTLNLRDIAGGSRGGPEYFYRVSIGPPQPLLSATMPSPTVVLKPGAKTDVTARIVARQVSPPLTLDVTGLPVGVTSDAGAGGPGDRKITLTASGDARPGSYTLRFRVTGGAISADVQARWVLSTDRSGTLAEGVTSEILLVIPG